jgi:hypothetical protein
MMEVASSGKRAALTLIWLPVPVMLLLVLLPLWLQRSFCPANTLVAGHLVGAATAFGAIIVGMALLFGGVGLLGSNNPKLSGERQQRAHRIALIALVLTVPASLMWLDGLFTYYCATPQSIVVHPDPFVAPVTYSWSDIRRISVGCQYGKGGMSLQFDLTMKDGHRIFFGGDSWSQLAKNYPQVSGILSMSIFDYDTTNVTHCPQRWKDVFARRPGT